MIIYKSTNIITNDFYIGQTKKKLYQRISAHHYDVDRGSKYHFHNAIRLYGKDNFIWHIIDCADTIEELNDKERYYIEKLKPKYNMTSGGEGCENRIISEETKEKIRKKQIGKPHPHKGTKGRIPWNKGKKGSQIPWNKGLKGVQVAWNKGLKINKTDEI